MVTRHKVNGFDECVSLLETLSEDVKVILYFSGKENENGVSWCSDCQIAAPIVTEVVQENEEKAFHFVYVSVGSREEWKDPTNQFRNDNRFKLTSVPTLMIYKAVERLNDVECQDKENIRALFENI